MRIFLQSSVPIQPHTGGSLLKFRCRRPAARLSVKNVIWVLSFSRALPFFPAFLRWHAHSLRAISFVVVVFRLAVLFHCPPRAGPARSGSATRPLLCSMLLCELRAAGSCASAEHGGASFSSSFSRMLVVSRANRSFRVVFDFSRCRRESVRVCVCVCVCDQFTVSFE